MKYLILLMTSIIILNCSPTSNEDESELIGTWNLIHSFTELGNSWSGSSIIFKENTYSWKGNTGNYDMTNIHIYLDIRYKYTLNNKLVLKYGGNQLDKYYYEFKKK